MLYIKAKTVSLNIEQASTISGENTFLVLKYIDMKSSIKLACTVIKAAKQVNIVSFFDTISSCGYYCTEFSEKFLAYSSFYELGFNRLVADVFETGIFKIPILKPKTREWVFSNGRNQRSIAITLRGTIQGSSTQFASREFAYESIRDLFSRRRDSFSLLLFEKEFHLKTGINLSSLSETIVGAGNIGILHLDHEVFLNNVKGDLPKDRCSYHDVMESGPFTTNRSVISSFPSINRSEKKREKISGRITESRHVHMNAQEYYPFILQYGPCSLDWLRMFYNHQTFNINLLNTMLTSIFIASNVFLFARNAPKQYTNLDIVMSYRQINEVDALINDPELFIELSNLVLPKQFRSNISNMKESEALQKNQIPIKSPAWKKVFKIAKYISDTNPDHSYLRFKAAFGIK